MEFKLNKIDTDIRKKLQEEVKEDKVHSTKSTSIKKDIVKDKKENDDNRSNKKRSISQEKQKNIIIDGIKYNAKPIKIDAQKIEEINEINSKGRNLDAKR